MYAHRHTHTHRVPARTITPVKPAGGCSEGGTDACVECGESFPHFGCAARRCGDRFCFRALSWWYVVPIALRHLRQWKWSAFTHMCKWANEEGVNKKEKERDRERERDKENSERE